MSCMYLNFHLAVPSAFSRLLFWENLVIPDREKVGHWCHHIVQFTHNSTGSSCTSSVANGFLEFPCNIFQSNIKELTV